MVARTPPKQQHHHLKQKKMLDPIDPILLRQTLLKVDKCMDRLQELQYLVTGGNKVVSGITLSPRSTRGYLRTSLRCKQESLRIKNGNSRRSPPGKLPTSSADWRGMSLPAMLLGETVGEILQAGQFAKEIAEIVDPKKTNIVKNQQVFSDKDPKTPLTKNRLTNQRRQCSEKSELRVRRKREKQMPLQSTSPSLQRAKSRIEFKVPSPPLRKGGDYGSNRHYMEANRVSPRHRPWVKKTVLFPNPLFHSSPSSKQDKFCRTKSPVITKKHQTPHKFLIKSPVKIRSPPLCISPTRGRTAGLGKLSPKMSTAARIRRSLSPSRLASRLVSPLKSRKSVQKSDGGMMKNADGMRNMMSGLKQRPNSVRNWN